MELFSAPKSSPLRQSIDSSGVSVAVEIYEGDPGKWILEVVDQYGNSTVWDDQFPSDYDALAEVKRVILEDGIESLIGPPTEKGGL